MAQYGKTFKQWFEDWLAWLIKQRPETTSEASPYQRLDSATCISAVNYCITDLVLDAERRYKAVVTYKLDEDTNRFHLPYEVAKVLGYYNTTTCDFEKIPDESELSQAIRRESDDIIYNEDGWSKGDELRLLIVRRPPKINTENDIVPFPEDYMLLLSVNVADWVKVQSGENTGPAHDRAYIRLLSRWRMDGGRVPATYRTRKASFQPIGRV